MFCISLWRLFNYSLLLTETNADAGYSFRLPEVTNDQFASLNDLFLSLSLTANSFRIYFQLSCFYY